MGHIGWIRLFFGKDLSGGSIGLYDGLRQLHPCKDTLKVGILIGKRGKILVIIVVPLKFIRGHQGCQVTSLDDNVLYGSHQSSDQGNVGDKVKGSQFLGHFSNNVIIGLQGPSSQHCTTGNHPKGMSNETTRFVGIDGGGARGFVSCCCHDDHGQSSSSLAWFDSSSFFFCLWWWNNDEAVPVVQEGCGNCESTLC